MLWKKKYIAVLVIKEQGKYTLVGKKNITATTETVRFDKKKAFKIDIDNPIYQVKNKLFYFFNYNRGQLSLRETVKKAEEPEVMDMIINKKIVEQLTSNLLGIDFKQQLIYIAVGAIAGSGFGYIFGLSGWFQG
ncbi:MAG: hypothetical protein ACOC1X_00330 [Promethearchaeota archaeon]